VSKSKAKKCLEILGGTGVVPDTKNLGGVGGDTKNSIKKGAPDGQN